MNIEQAATLLAGSILTMLALIVVVIGIVTINNIIHKYWKNLDWFKSWYAPVKYEILSDSHYARLVEEENKRPPEFVEPSLGEDKTSKEK